MGSLEDNQNVTETVRTEFDALLKTKDAPIQDLQDKALLELDKKYQEQIQKLKADKQADIDKYQEKYLELLNKMQEKWGLSCF